MSFLANSLVQNKSVPCWSCSRHCYGIHHLHCLFRGLRTGGGSLSNSTITGLGKRMVSRLREFRLLTPSGRGARVHAT